MRPSKGVQGLDAGCLISESGPGLALFTFCRARLDKRPLWREGTPAQQGWLKACSILTEGCCEEDS